MDVTIKSMADRRLIRSPKFNNPMAKPPSTTVKFNQLRNVRSLAKNTLGSTRTGNAILFPVGSKSGCDDIDKVKMRQRKKLCEICGGFFPFLCSNTWLWLCYLRPCSFRLNIQTGKPNAQRRPNWDTNHAIHVFYSHSWDLSKYTNLFAHWESTRGFIDVTYTLIKSYSFWLPGLIKYYSDAFFWARHNGVLRNSTGQKTKLWFKAFGWKNRQNSSVWINWHANRMRWYFFSSNPMDNDKTKSSHLCHTDHVSVAMWLGE